MTDVRERAALSQAGTSNAQCRRSCGFDARSANPPELRGACSGLPALVPAYLRCPGRVEP